MFPFRPGASPQPDRSAAPTLQPLPGARYFFRLDDTVTCPDPASFSQPDGVHGPSQLIDHMAFSWQDQAWTGIPLDNQIIYELHTGAFSDSHDFDGVRKRLDYLSDLGINAIELMPLAQFPGSRNWGYDGVYPFAIQDSYGGIPGSSGSSMPLMPGALPSSSTWSTIISVPKGITCPSTRPISPTNTRPPGAMPSMSMTWVR